MVPRCFPGVVDESRVAHAQHGLVDGQLGEWFLLNYWVSRWIPFDTLTWLENGRSRRSIEKCWVLPEGRLPGLKPWSSSPVLGIATMGEIELSDTEMIIHLRYHHPRWIPCPAKPKGNPGT